MSQRMKRISDYQRILETDAEVVRRLLEAWRPSSYSLTEKEQEQSLLAYLRVNLPDVPIVPQYGIAKGKADIVIQDEHVLELKLGFTEDCVAEFDRCLGQLWRYKEKWVERDRGRVWLIVVGHSEAEFRDLLTTWFNQANGSYLTWSPFTWIDKRSS